MERILNLTKIREILADNEQEILEILSMLEESIPEFINKVEKYEQEENLEQLKFTIHKFKSSCQLITEQDFIDRLRAIEKSDPFILSDQKPSLDILIQDCHQLKKEIEKHKSDA